jgi:Pregnancy-associated plasma protein-A/Secretion system C-terminal sorting domain
LIDFSYICEASSPKLFSFSYHLSFLSGMKPLFFPLLALIWACPLSAQTQPTPAQILCGNEMLHHLIEDKYPELAEGYRQTFEAAKILGAQHINERAPLTVNVVVHVVWLNPEENLADSIILNQLAVLNADYNRQNADTSNLRPIFSPYAGSPNVNFNLVDIKRIQTTKKFELDILGGDLLSNLKYTAEGGSDAEDPSKFINIWICKIQPITIFGVPIGQILGFAFPPNNLPNWPADSAAPKPEEDGVVLDFRTVGSNNPNMLENPGAAGSFLTIRGRTATHEVGHYLGLRHIWGDGGSPLGGGNDCAQSDGIDDTPFASEQSPFDCDKTRNTCEIIEQFFNADMPDLIENYMDYSSETCMNTFTKGQASLIRGVLEGPRKSLIEASSVQTAPAANLTWRMVPNPASDMVRLQFNLPQTEKVNIKMFSSTGQLILQSPVSEYPAGTNEVVLSITDLPTGLYQVMLQTEHSLGVQQLMVD